MHSSRSIDRFQSDTGIGFEAKATPTGSPLFSFTQKSKHGTMGTTTGEPTGAHVALAKLLVRIQF